MKKLKEISKKFASASTVIGFTRIVRAETKLMKVFWVLMTLVSLAFGIYLTSGTIKEYLDYDVFTQTKIIQATSSLMPSVTFCIHDSDTKDFNAFFDQADFSSPTGFKANLTGEQFYQEGFGDCIKFNHFTNKSEYKLYTANTLNDKLSFKIDLNKVKFNFVDVFLSDNYDNILDWSQYITGSYAFQGSYLIDIKKELELKLEEPYNRCQNVSDITYRQTNCLALCKNRNFVSRNNCTLRNFYSIPGDRFCIKDISNFCLYKFKIESILECGIYCTQDKSTCDMKEMKKGDLAFFYHSVHEKQIVGIVEIVREYYPDFTDETGKFCMVDVRAIEALPHPVSLALIKSDPRLSHLSLCRQSRLSVMPIDELSWKIILEMENKA